ncbi:MAG: helix-turn-helix transcriptional regulator [Ktedonobacteraceae bacterium]
MDTDGFADEQELPDNLTENKVAEESVDKRLDTSGPKYEMTERILRLLQYLTTAEYTRQELLERMKDYYQVGESGNTKGRSSRSDEKKFSRDVEFLQNMGYEIDKAGVGNAARYSLVKGSGPVALFMFSKTELDTLVLLHTLFADPATYTRADATQPLPQQSPRSPFAEEILKLIERFVAPLSPEQKREFERWVGKPFIYLNIDMVTDYLPHRATIDTIVRAITQRQQIQFEYTSLQQRPIYHEHVDPYYIVHQDGHLYLLGYAHKSEKVLEYRVDRINPDTIKLQPDMIDVVRRRYPIEFQYWIDGSIAKSGLSQRWLSQTIEREEAYVDEQSKQRRKVLVRAKAYSEWRIIQQMLKYGDKVELVGPPHLRKEMRKVVQRMANFYQ